MPIIVHNRKLGKMFFGKQHIKSLAKCFISKQHIIVNRNSLALFGTINDFHNKCDNLLAKVQFSMLCRISIRLKYQYLHKLHVIANTLQYNLLTC